MKMSLKLQAETGAARQKIRRRSDADFACEVKQKVEQYFTASGLTKHANAAMIIKTMVLVGAYLASYGLIISGLLPLLLMWFLCVIMGVAMAGIGFAVTHDALHGAYSANPTVNRFVGYIFDGLGANSYIWRRTHNVLHHTYTNIHRYDEDLEVAGFIRLSPHTPHKTIHRIQHLLAFFAYSLATVFWVFVKDYKYFLASRLGTFQNKGHPASEWLFLLLTKLLYYAMMIAVPLLVLDIKVWQYAVGFLTLHLTAGLILGVIFQLAHVVEETTHVEQHEAGVVKQGWMTHELQTTNNFARDSRCLSWYIGGLNYQIEHHLFPRICHVHYPALSRIVEATAAKHGLPYNSHPTLWIAIRSHYRTLKTFGDPAYGH